MPNDFAILSYRDVIDIVKIVLQFEGTTDTVVSFLSFFLMLQGHQEGTRYIITMDDIKTTNYMFNKVNNMNPTLNPSTI